MQLLLTKPSPIRKRSTRSRLPFVAEVIYDAECDMWVASCDVLGVVTEAPSYEAVTARFWEIAPEVAVENGITFDASSRVQFHQVVIAGARAQLTS